jgi:glycine betaine/proline transport system ATP-binding protein
MKQAGISSIYVINKSKEFLGVVTADAAAEAVKNGNKDIYDVMITDVPVVAPDLSLNDLFELIHNSPVPVAVVENKILKGIIVRGAVLAALAGNEVNLNGSNTTDTNS